MIKEWIELDEYMIKEWSIELDEYMMKEWIELDEYIIKE